MRRPRNSHLIILAKVLSDTAGMAALCFGRTPSTGLSSTIYATQSEKFGPGNPSGRSTPTLGSFGPNVFPTAGIRPFKSQYHSPSRYESSYYIQKNKPKGNLFASSWFRH